MILMLSSLRWIVVPAYIAAAALGITPRKLEAKLREHALDGNGNG